MVEEDITMGMDRLLTDKGKEKLFNVIKEYIDAKIDLRTLHMRPSLNQEEVEKRASDAKKKLIEIIIALDWRIA